MKRGRVSWFSDKGIGWIIEDGHTNPSTIFHYSVVKKGKDSEWVELNPKDDVLYSSVKDGDIEVATEVIRCNHINEQRAVQ